MSGRAAAVPSSSTVAREETEEREKFAAALLDWFDAHGRHDLPWQRDRSPYRVWVSEIMLQQTQVATVIPYYERFMDRFPDIESLAAASIDEVLHLWTGLGYYARARNMHRAAKGVQHNGGRLPEDVTALEALPGIGRSTAGAILALSLGQRHPILDGNARRVLARHFGIEGHTAEPHTLRCLWDIAGACTPHERVAAYTQAIMDLGATVCTRAHPACLNCPLRTNCMAFASGRQSDLPGRRPSRTRLRRKAVALILRSGDAVLLQQQPGQGLWGGLWTFPQFDTQEEAFEWARRIAGAQEACYRLPRYKHSFTHFDLTLSPLVLHVMSNYSLPANLMWYDPTWPPKIGITKPVTALLPLVAKARNRCSCEH